MRRPERRPEGRVPQPAIDVRSSAFAEQFERIAGNVARIIQGKDDVIELVLVCLLAEGHLLLEDVPGVGKTSLAKALAASIEGTFGRVQFTPDLLPADVVGVSVYDRSAGRFEFRPGPVFANIILADEINRASPKTQSALLESMAEGQVTVDGATYTLESPFLVLATQNPIDHEGTFPLPESQLDRFLMRVRIGYPGRSAELEILATHADRDPLEDLAAVVTAAEVRAMSVEARAVHVDPALLGYLVDLAEASRRHPALALGMSPRATLSLLRVVRVRAAAAGRRYATPDDVKALAHPVLAHRLLVTPDAQVHGTTGADVVDALLGHVPVPRGAGR
ncbi:MAG: MoxR family ATPase [Actinobacteria bacterium]|nr:MoxR family ATPase [Actinomycetota bacterium]